MSTSNASTDLGSAVRVVVTPSQSSYFAGEPFTVTITFTNTRTPESRPSRHVSHTRGAHSISSAPLARPPTSPGTPKSSAPGILSRPPVDRPARKGSIGKTGRAISSNDSSGSSGQRKRALTKSLSISITPRDLEERLREECKRDDSPPPHSIGPPHPNDPPRYPLVRSPFLSMSSNHPHSRKQSVLDGQLQPHEVSSHSVPHSPLPLSPFIPSASTSTFSLVLDPIAENTPMPYSPTPATSIPEAPPVPSQTPAYRMGPSYSKQHRRPSPIGLGQPPLNVSKSLGQPRTAFSSSFSQANIELILYSYVQLIGTVHIATPAGVVPTQTQMETLSALRSKLARRTTLGGGSMDIASFHQGRLPQPPVKRPTHRRSASFSSSILSLLSPSSLISSTPTSASIPQTSLRSSSSISLPGLEPTSPSLDGLGKVGLGIVAQEEIDPETPLPTFEVQPAMLAVDLPLRPGESRSYKYTVRLPDNLPPTFRGRSMRFSYELVVGTCRAGSSSASADAGSTSANGVSRVMKVPIRVYNHVSVGRPPLPYDLLWPVGKRGRPGSDAVVQAVEDVGIPPTDETGRESFACGCGSLQEVQDYARMLLGPLTDSNVTGTRIEFPSDPTRGEIEPDEEGALTGCREAVDLLTRNFKKVSYDVNKDGVKVAVLTFTKSAYRLGETVLGVVELNERTSLARVLKLSARLESQESLPSAISPPPNPRNMRRVHAEHHSSFVLSTLRTTFALDIPSDASPAFQMQVGGEAGVGGLEWKVRLCLLVAVASESSESGTEGVRLKSLVRDGPRGRWGSAWRATKGISPLEYQDMRVLRESGQMQNRSWMSFLASSLLGIDEDESGWGNGNGDDEGEYDGVRGSWDGGVGVGVDFGGGEEGWREVSVETVECEVPIKVWPGNTVFKAVDVEFHVW